MAHAGGRPLKFKTPEILQEKIANYFNECDEQGIPYTITGVALALDTSRETLLNYEERDEYFDAIKSAKLKCQNYAEKYLYTGKNTAGAIFNLKNNYGWRDRTESDVTTNGKEIQVPIFGGLSGRPEDVIVPGHNSNQTNIQPHEKD